MGGARFQNKLDADSFGFSWEHTKKTLYILIFFPFWVSCKSITFILFIFQVRHPNLFFCELGIFRDKLQFFWSGGRISDIILNFSIYRAGKKILSDNHEVIPDSFYDTFEIHSTIDVARGGVCVEDFFCVERDATNLFHRVYKEIFTFFYGSLAVGSKACNYTGIIDSSSEHFQSALHTDGFSQSKTQ